MWAKSRHETNWQPKRVDRVYRSIFLQSVDLLRSHSLAVSVHGSFRQPEWSRFYPSAWKICQFAQFHREISLASAFEWHLGSDHKISKKYHWVIIRQGTRAKDTGD